MEKKGGIRKSILIIAAATAAVIAAVYFWGVWFYSTHFFFGTEIGSFNCSNMTADEAKAKITNDIENYGFTFFEKDGKTEIVTGKEIGLTAAAPDNLQELLQEQKPFLWLTSLKSRSLPLKTEAVFNRHTLYNRITQLDFAKKSREAVGDYTEKIYFEDGQFRVKDDGMYDVISINDIYSRAKAKIKDLYLGMSLEKENCYKGIADDDAVKGVLNLANKFTAAKITYNCGGETTLLDGNTINQWVNIGENSSVKINTDKVREYVDSMAKKYNTVGKERNFKTSSGDNITVSGGDYGRKINADKETQELCALIWDGAEAEREPVYIQKSQGTGTNDIGNTYVEISIGSQHLWYYKDGALIIDTAMVSGDPTKNRATSKGVFRLKYKDKNVVLKGEDYETPVTFWMPFNGGIGLHDATWRGRFGGGIYRGGGSHGCVNLPYSAAEKIFKSINPGEPVIVY